MSSLSEQYKTVRYVTTSIEKDIAKAEKGNVAAGVRVRKAMQALKEGAQGIRETVLLERK